jgi:protein involved in polysaccharide export with SLBB domain
MCQRSVLLGALLWAVSLAAYGQAATAVSTGATATAAPMTTAAPATSGFDSGATLDSATVSAAQAMAADRAAADAQAETSAAPRPASGRANEQQSNFQRFVQQATGRALPIYGQNLFSSPSSYAPISQALVPNDYLLGPGDEIHLQIWGAVNAEQRLVIDRNGQVNLPRVGVVTLAGVRAGDLESVLRSNIGRNFTNFSLNATLGRLRSIQVYVVGQARQPGTYTVSSLSTLINALFEVGGPNVNGSMRAIQLKRNGALVGEFDLYDFIARGDRSGDVPLQPGDVIVIPPAGPRVAVVGAFEQPAIYELKGDSSVGEVLALGGGLPVLTTPAKALLERIDPAASTPRQVEDLVLDSAGLQRPLRDGDILTLFGISPQFANAVTLRGNVAAPLRYPYQAGMRVRDLIPDRDALITADYYQRKNLLVLFDEPGKPAIEKGVRNLLDEVNWDYAVIERLDRSTLTPRLIPFNLGRAVLEGDEQNNLALEPGDVVTVLGKKDLRTPVGRQTRLVRVEGEVAAPGIYQVESGETLPQLLARLGGVTPDAYLFGTEFTRESVRQQQQTNLDTVIRKLEAQLQGEAARLTANTQAEADKPSQLAVQQQMMQKQLASLKSLRSNGRISLELPPSDNGLAALPALPLEDGDAIHIPSRPGFVSAVGEVHNENAILHRPGRTVGDVLKTAGMSADAEPGSAFVLRADGSVMAARDNKGFFGMGTFEDIELMPGDTVVVPAKLDRQTGWTKFVAGLKDWTQIIFQMGLGVAAWNTLD